MLTLEFVLWSNCPNNCRFCWQRLFDDKTAWLSQDEKVKCLTDCSKKIEQEANDCDILLVGGEAYCDQGERANEKLSEIYNQIAAKIKNGDVRFLYANTNLTYKERVNLESLFKAFKGIEDHLKFTTSYDLDGRFNRLNESESKNGCAKIDRRGLFLENLKWINDNHPAVNTVVNTIITRAVADAVLKEGYDTHWFIDEFPNTVNYVNLIPYIPIEGDDALDVKFSETIKVLEAANKKYPGYFRDYVMMFDLNQDKLLYEYHSDTGFVERTAGTLPCGHNENFQRINRSGECFICKLIEYYNDNKDRLS